MLLKKESKEKRIYKRWQTVRIASEEKDILRFDLVRSLCMCVQQEAEVCLNVEERQFKVLCVYQTGCAEGRASFSSYPHTHTYTHTLKSSNYACRAEPYTRSSPHLVEVLLHLHLPYVCLYLLQDIVSLIYTGHLSLLKPLCFVLLIQSQTHA